MKHLLTVAVALFATCGSVLGQDWAKAMLEKSPRHQEWVEVKHGNRVAHAFIVYPEIKEKAPAVLVIHEIFGLTDWVRSVADNLQPRDISQSHPTCSRVLALTEKEAKVSPAPRTA
jgi:carboxymethylenebutenolidase